MAAFNPTPQQQAAIDCHDSIVITACPGSGKTTVMTAKIRQVTAKQPSHKGVIAITFTKKASEELKKRCKENVHDTKLSFFGTIDSFCLKEIIQPFLGRIWGGKPTDCRIIKSLDGTQRALFSHTYNSPTIDELISDQGFKQLYNNGVLWMSSFAALSNFIINNSSSAQRYIQARYSHVFIDEYQDSSKAQHELFIKLLELGLIATAVGDIDQSIYRFRGGCPELLTDLTTDTVNFRHFELNVNHRSHPSIINYASRVLDEKHQLIPHDDEICVFRCTLQGGLKNAAETITTLITELLENGSIPHARNIAILAKKENSLIEFSLGLGFEYRLYKDTPLNDIGTECADIYSDILSYKYGSIKTAQDLIERFSFKLKSTPVKDLRKSLKAIHAEQDLEKFIIKCSRFLELMGYRNFEDENNAVRAIWTDSSLMKMFKIVSDNEVQLMTLHKSKGLEFKVVFHLDMEEWSFPYRIPGANWDDIQYPSLVEDTNLHYVGITRAELFCLLIRTSLRRNSQGNYSQSNPSYFLRLPQLEGLYQVYP
ncbi:UvrD-helicase domain-containing protein [Aeromonas veronii]|uniref:UvrD-helicase domain-containing protein n=1 Tax=Aeromonas veronii TaxID=654 RepID=UPI003B9F99E8